MTESIKAKPKQRLSYDARRQAILDAVIPLFVDQGFKGVTTRLLAQRAGVSEALLYQHFPSKEALYSEVQDVLCAESPHISAHLRELTPSTQSLIWILYLAARHMISPPGGIDTSPLFPRLMLQSLMDDGEFARLHTQRRLGEMADIVTQSIQAAREAGDIGGENPDDTPNSLLFWFAHHVMAMVHLMNLSEQPVLDYPADRKQLIDYVMIYVLRGIGLTENALKKHYHAAFLHDKFEALFGSS